MSVQSSAWAVIGLRLPEDSLYTTELKRNCGCKVDGQPKFCPECGCQFTYPVRVFWLGDPDANKINNFSLVWSTDRRSAFIGVASPEVVIGRHRDNDCARLKLDGDNLAGVFKSINGIRERLQAWLQPLGRWYEMNFGIWCVGCCNY